MHHIRLMLRLAVLAIVTTACRSGSNLEATIEAQNTTIPEFQTSLSTSVDETPLPLMTVGPTRVLHTPIPPATAAFTSHVFHHVLYTDKHPPDQGWVPYETALALSNSGQRSLYMSKDRQGAYYGSYEPSLRSMVLLTQDSAVETAEGEIYPVSVSGATGSAQILPAGLPISGKGGTRQQGSTPLLSVHYRVPELLHPTKLEIRPGLSHQGGEPQPLTIDLTRPPTGYSFPDPTLPFNSLPATVQAGESIQVTINPPTLAAVDYHADSFTFNLELIVQNTDITSDQPLQFELFLVDGLGWAYPTRSRSLPDYIGPGQVETVLAEFVLPIYAAFGSTQLYIPVFTDTVDRSYTFAPPGVTKCGQPEDVHELPTWHPVSEEAVLTVPGEASGSFAELMDSHRYLIQAIAGQAIRIDVAIGDPPDDTPVWRLLVTDPEGNTVMWDMHSPNRGCPGCPRRTWLGTWAVPLFCSGTYSAYIVGEGTYTISANPIPTGPGGVLDWSVGRQW